MCSASALSKPYAAAAAGRILGDGSFPLQQASRNVIEIYMLIHRADKAENRRFSYFCFALQMESGGINLSLIGLCAPFFICIRGFSAHGGDSLEFGTHTSYATTHLEGLTEESVKSQAMLTFPCSEYPEGENPPMACSSLCDVCPSVGMCGTSGGHLEST